MDKFGTLVLRSKVDRNGIPKRLDVVRAENAATLDQAVADLPAGEYTVHHNGQVVSATVDYVTTQTNTFN